MKTITKKPQVSEAKKEMTPTKKVPQADSKENKPEVKKSTQNEPSNKEDSKATVPQVSSPVQVLIKHIKTDQELLTIANRAIDKAKNEKKDIADRLKEYRRDAYHLFKFATPKEQEELNDLGFDLESSESRLNSIAETALEILTKANRKMTCEELHNEYVANVKVGEEALSYTEFNIKIRSLFRSQRLIQQTVEDGNNSRTDLVYLNGVEYKK